MPTTILGIRKGTCEFTGKPNTECYRVKFDDKAPESLIAPNQLFRMLKFQEKQQSKRSNRSKPAKSVPSAAAASQSQQDRQSE